MRPNTLVKLKLTRNGDYKMSLNPHHKLETYLKLLRMLFKVLESQMDIEDVEEIIKYMKEDN